MSSREIATLCDKEHRNVCRDIENLNATYGQMGMLKIEQTKQTLAIAEPKAQYFDKLVERNLLTNFTTTAKQFGVKRKDLIDYLLDNGYIYRDQRGNLLPYAVHVPHLFEVKEYSKDAHSGVQTLVTPKGRETLRLLLT